MGAGVLRSGVFATGIPSGDFPQSHPCEFLKPPHHPQGTLHLGEKPEERDHVEFICLPVLETQGPLQGAAQHKQECPG